MDFAEARAAFFQPREGAVSPDAADGTSPARRLRHVLEPLAMVHIWGTPAHERLAAAGLDFLAGYVGARACVLGDPAGPVVAAAFGVFEPGLVADLWATARSRCSVDALRDLRAEGGTEGLRAALDGVDAGEVAEVAGVLGRAAGAADPAGKPLFAGLTGLPDAGDPFTRLWHAANLFREHRGDVHLAACTAAAVDGLEANVLTELHTGFPALEYTASRGWSPAAMDAAVGRLEQRGWVRDGALSPDGRAARTAIEDATDRAQQRLLDALDDVEALLDPLGRWADAVLARGWFPPDPYKRAAG